MSLHAEEGRAIRYKGMVDCFVRTVKEEGIAALFKGIIPNYVKVRRLGAAHSYTLP